MNPVEFCPACGARVTGGRDGCQALWDEVHAQALQVVGGLPLPEAAFDAYCLQHPETYCVSAKSYAAHLTRLCCGVEHPGDARVLAAIQRWLNGSPRLQKPALLPNRGQICVTEVWQAGSAAERSRTARAWVLNVWQAYTPQQALARLWLNSAVA